MDHVTPVKDQASTESYSNVGTSQQRRTRIAFAILTRSSKTELQGSKRFAVIHREFKSQIPNGPGKEANENGTWVCPFEYPGIPKNKFFSKTEAPEDFDWKVQNVFKIKGETSPATTYEGSDVLWYEDDDFAAANPEAMKLLETRHRFLEALQKTTEDPEVLKCIDRDQYLTKELFNNQQHLYWHYEDVSYYHNKIHVDYGIAGFSYMCLREEMVAPPNFQYIPYHVVKESAYKRCLASKGSKKYLELEAEVAGNKSFWSSKRTPTACEKPEKCKCNRIFQLLYKDTEDSLEDPRDRELPRKLLQPNKAGFLDLEHFNYISNQKIIVECSNACGCSEECPRRRLQQGQKKRLVVFYENEIIGFGLRAAEPIKAGEYVTEYVGTVLAPRNNNRNPSYDLGIEIVVEGLVIDSRKCGNLARFVAHACEPNAAFIETHSRIFETDPLIPRVSLYALRDIAIGEAVTICYYSRDKLSSGKGIKCACRPNCPNHLPKN
ncbi:hypothetical protein L5515_012418 [Caenorhabditis briggsae]|uniref:SET domain-containing protein n=1 Tax=Caenorhabditis briggsae TaxID=6238 RepID=A0AAE9JHT9_CAEBR|nr:hypothetical protein L5515_012418 [Caenorhabditis briggsae]